MNVAFAREAEALPRWKFSSSDVSRMVKAGILGEDERIELIDGDLIRMAAKGFRHDALKDDLARLLGRTAPDDMVVAVESTLRLAERVIVEPELFVFARSLRRAGPDGFLSLSGGDILLVIEIAASSLRYDKGPKAALYARHGVRECWVVDAETRVTWVHTGPQADGTWASVAEKRPDETLTAEALPGFSVSLDQLD